ncbi:uncharacterized protein Dwil_GK25234 [Drosophila willistoni]|uniref:Kinesin motor domain-containing protein n=1 Tax=Drosophila willistoni TaxID=7260 RepID=B4NER1_DROWI|nr:kinesin-like protein Nod [Drosophila willistoni]EDW82230.2 uncharacterized protein Dwil_GK25234 [Drosophila willistoni]
MAANKLSAVRIAVKEAPITICGSGRVRSDESVVHYPPQCANSVAVGDNVFCFDFAFGPTVSQRDLYNTLIQPMVDKVMDGIDCTVLAYGQTGTGKSYTMGLAYSDFCDEQHLGIAPRCLKAILDSLSQEQENRIVSAQVFASFIEVYNEKAYELLGRQSTQICSRGQRFNGGIQMPIRNQDDLLNVLKVGTQNRHVRPTNMNQNSSRSHAILTIYVLRPNCSKSVRFNIVDLAGSEGVRRTGHEGIARQEGVYINHGLLSINKVLMSMSSGHAVIPYRDSTLTTMLQESINARSYFTLLACISPHTCDLAETNSTLHFAKGAKRLKQQHKRFAAATNTMPTDFRRPLPSSTAIKRPRLYNSNTSNNRGLSSFSSPPKRFKSTLVRTRSEMGLTPKAKEHTRQEFIRMRQQPILIDVSNSISNGIPLPTYEDYLDLKMKNEQLQRQLHLLTLEQGLRQASSVPSFECSSTLYSINEEELENKTPVMFTSSPTSVSGVAPISIISDITALDSTIVNAPVQEQISADETIRRPTSRRAIARKSNFITSNDASMQTRRRSQRIAMKTQSSQRSKELSGNILRLLNNGNEKELQQLPLIGPKTARSIILQRQRLGSFVNWKQIQSLPIWHGSTWNRFVAHNCLDID